MNRLLKIAIYSGAVPSTTFIERLIHGLAVSGYEVYLFGIQNKKVKSRGHVHFFTYKTNRISKLFQLLKYSLMLTLFKLKDKKRLDIIISSKNENPRLLKVKYYPVLYHKPDIFHLQWAKSLEDWIWVQDFGIKLVLSLRGTHITISPIANKTLAELYVEFFPKVNAFHAVSSATSLLAQNYGASSSRIKTIYSGLPSDMVFHQKTKPKGLLKILSIGRSHWTKGYVHALDAMALLKHKKGIPFKYTIVGVDDDEELQFQRAQLGLEHEVEFLGLLPFETVKDEIIKADVLLLSSVEEGIANVVLEAMALGTLVVSTDCGGMNEVIRNRENGFLVPIRNPLEMALTLQDISTLSLEDYHNICKTARKTVERQHNIEDTIKNMKALYHYVLNDMLCE